MKDILIKEYRYSVLITNLPKNFKRDKVAQLAQKVIRNNNSNKAYMMSAYDYIIDPHVCYNNNDYDLYYDSKKKIDNNHIDFTISYDDIKKDSSYDYIIK
ncbi:MAG: hypothetical protein ACRC18_07000 [Cetobacterium sp.]